MKEKEIVVIFLSLLKFHLEYFIEILINISNRVILIYATI